MGKITASMCVLALILFLFPWLNVSCKGPEGSGEINVGSQSGCQIMYGGFSKGSGNDQMSQMMGGGGEQEDASKEKPAGSLLTILAFLAVLGGAAIAVAAELIALPLKLSPKLKGILESIRAVPVKAGVLTGIALVLLLFTWVIGFPIAHKVSEAQAQMAKQADSDMPISMDISVNYLFPFYLELLVLIPPTFLVLNGKFKWVALDSLTGSSGAAGSPGAAPAANVTPPAETGPPADAGGGGADQPPQDQEPPS